MTNFKYNASAIVLLAAIIVTVLSSASLRAGAELTVGAGKKTFAHGSPPQ